MMHVLREETHKTIRWVVVAITISLGIWGSSQALSYTSNIIWLVVA